MFRATMRNGKRINSPIADEKKFLNEKASEISTEFEGNPPVIVVVGGIGRADNDFEPTRVIFGFHPKGIRYRDRAGILQTAIIEDYFLKNYRLIVEQVKDDIKKEA